jgi:glycosyltransferase involved in cell wall biosynthesis
VKIRVLEVLATLKRAGAERMAVSLARGLDPCRFEARVVSLFDAFPGGFESELEVPCLHLGKRPGLDVRMYPRLLAVFREFRPALVHTHSYLLRYAFPAALAARAGRLVHTVHNVAEREVEALGRALHRVAFRCGVTPVAVSGEVARSCERVYGFRPRTIPNGIDAARFRRPQARAAWRRAHGFGEDDLLVVSVARLAPQKNPEGLVQAFQTACGENMRAHLLLCGEGTLANRSNRVHLLGVQQDVGDLLAASDIFALASHWEGHPMAVMEAMAAGLPVVATAVGGVPELVQAGATGLLVPAGDVPAFAAALRALAEDTGRRREFAEAARRKSADFGVDNMVRAYAGLFESLWSS